jgi:hypothetical protein
MSDEGAIQKNMRPQLKRSKSLEDFEEEQASDALKSFNEKQEGDQESMFTFADRQHWAHFRKLLTSTAEDNEVLRESPCSHLATPTELAEIQYAEVVDNVLTTMKKRAESPNTEAFLEDTFVSACLKDCIFVGHTSTDLDSIAGAIGAAKLYNGTAAKSEDELNGEIKHVLNLCGIEEPQLYDAIPGASQPIEDKGEKIWKDICLVDHNERAQMVESLKNDPNRHTRIKGLIDHHTMAESFCTNTPAFIEVCGACDVFNKSPFSHSINRYARGAPCPRSWLTCTCATMLLWMHPPPGCSCRPYFQTPSIFRAPLPLTRIDLPWHCWRSWPRKMVSWSYRTTKRDLCSELRRAGS